MVPLRGDPRQDCLASRTNERLLVNVLTLQLTFSVLASSVTPPPTLGEGGRLPKHWLEDTCNLSEAMC